MPKSSKEIPKIWNSLRMCHAAFKFSVFNRAHSRCFITAQLSGSLALEFLKNVPRNLPCNVLTSHTDFELLYLRAERTYSYTGNIPQPSTITVNFLPRKPWRCWAIMQSVHQNSTGCTATKGSTKRREGVGGRGGSL